MPVALDHARGSPPTQFLHPVQVHPVAHETGREGVPQVMKAQLGNLGSLTRLVETLHQVARASRRPQHRDEDEMLPGRPCVVQTE